MVDGKYRGNVVLAGTDLALASDGVMAVLASTRGSSSTWIGLVFIQSSVSGASTWQVLNPWQDGSLLSAPAKAQSRRSYRILWSADDINDDVWWLFPAWQETRQVEEG
jgi:hypothetical protein